MLSTQQALKRTIKSEAHRLGFHLVGVTTPDPPAHYSVFINWLKAGRHGEMGYLDSERSHFRRADPRNILPDCKSILVLGIRYPSGELLQQKKSTNNIADRGEENAEIKSSRTPITGRVASYAWGEDYHEVVAKRLQKIVHFIETQVGHSIPNRWYTDTGPILERDFAQRAGLGWIGKNTCLINPHSGSYFFLAEILLGIELVPDQPFVADRCGSCTRCIEACPTACILPDRTIDARRCISYLTIEHKGIIPVDLRPLIGDWVFGCDICQQVCPWNQRFASPEFDPSFAPHPGIPKPDLVQELSLSPEDFNRKFKGNPVKRTKRRGYLRNVAVALGNSGSPSTIPALSHALHNDVEPLVRAHAAWALGQMKGSASIEALVRSVTKETDETVLHEILSALRDLGIDGERLLKVGC